MSLACFTYMDLPFNADLYPGLGAGGDVVQIDLDTQQHIVLYSLIKDKFTQQWRKPLPARFPTNSSKAISKEGEVLLQYGLLTYMYTSNLYYKLDYGYLLTVMNGDRVVYKKWSAQDNLVLGVYNISTFEKLNTVKIPGNKNQMKMYAVEVDEQTGKIVITEYFGKSLSLLSATGETKHCLKSQLIKSSGASYII